MPLDHYVTLGRSGLRVSPMCLGAMTFGEDLGWGSSVEASQAIIDRFLERGGNFIDTANVYTHGHSEKIIGDHLTKDRLIAREKDSTPARVALAWLAQKPGVSSIILGARCLDQLEDNLAAAELVLSPEQVQKLDELSTPVLGFPASMAAIVPGFAYAGTTINGVSGPISPWVPQKDGARY